MPRNRLASLILAVAFTGAVHTGAAHAAPAPLKTYKVTAVILEIKGNRIIVEKGRETLELDSTNLKLPTNVKVGSKITLTYTMSAVSAVLKPKPPRRHRNER